MKQFRLNLTLLMLVLSVTAITSCTNEQDSTAKEAVLSADDTERLSTQDTIRIALGSNDMMKYDRSEITVFDGQTVVLTLTHTGTMPVTAMGHNFVLLAKGTSISGFAEEALKAKANDYIPTDASNVIAHTALIGGGESTVVTFQAPEKGSYDFMCSFPGHYSIMKGKFNVK